MNTKFIMTKTIPEIIEQGFEKVSQIWVERKKKEFQSSEIYDKEKDIQTYNELQIDFLYEEIDEGDGLSSNGSILEEHERIIEFTNTFRQYAKLPLINSDDSSLEIELTRNFYKGNEGLIYDLTTLSKDIADELEPFFSSTKSEQIVDLLYNIQDMSMILVEDSIGKCKEETLQLKRDLILMLAEELKLRNFVLLESLKFLKPYWQKLRFKLNTEDFSALIRILETSKIIFEEKTDILEFAEKHFMIKPQGKDFTNVFNSSLRKSMENHGTPSHNGLGLENVKNKVTDAIAVIQKPG